MKLTIERAALLKALGHVQSVVERRNTIPILSNVLLTAEGSRISFAATDLDMEILDESEASIVVPGKVTVSAHTLYEIVRKLPEGSDIDLDYSGDDPRLKVQAARSKFNLPVLPAEDFPTMTADSEGHSITLDTADLIRLVEKTNFAISREETRYYLNGLYVHTASEGGVSMFRAVATDGHRLALAELVAPAGLGEVTGVIIPRKTVAQIQRLLQDAGEVVQIKLSPQKVRLDFVRADSKGAALTSKVIDGSFPDYGRVIPKDNSRIALIDRDLFKQAVDRVATISAEKSRSVKLSIESGRLVLMVRNAEAGQAQEELEIDYNGESFDIGFNASYLLDVLNQIGGTVAEFRFADPSSPTLVLDPTDAGVRYVLMPLRV